MVGLLPSALRHPAVQHHLESGIDVPTAHRADQQRAPAGPCAAAPVARPGRPLAPPRLRAPDGAFAEGTLPDARAARGHRVDGEELGSGFVLATHDLRSAAPVNTLRSAERRDHRGRAGDVHGHARVPRFRALKGAKQPPTSRSCVTTEVNCTCRRCCRLITSPTCRRACAVQAHRRVRRCAGADDLQTEIGDRFGPCPKLRTALPLHVSPARPRAGIHRLDIGAQASHLVFGAHNSIDPPR